MKTPVEQQLLATLIELDVVVKLLLSANPKPGLQPLFSRIDELADQLPPSADPELRHFLQRKSYEKARRHLMERGGRASEDADAD
ncbi:MAG TPA: hypothetical protein VFY06_05495 [Verrucomicrobiae bacterium]|nr:hypothetical protein [Verrucomicrobiae bacterium]